MTRRTLPLLAACCALVLLSRAGAEPPESKLALKYKLELEIRKPGAPRTVTAETYHDSASGRLYYATGDRKSLALTDGEAPVTVADPIRPKWVRGFDLRVRAWDGEQFDADTPKVTVEVFRDASAKQLIYASEGGGLAVVSEPAAAKDAKEAKATPRWLYGLKLRVRPSGENDFTRNYLKLGVEVYLHEPTGHLIYVGHNGALAVVETKKKFGEMKLHLPKWTHALELKARKPDQKEFDPKTPRIGVEVYADDNAGVLLYATDALTLAAVPGTAADPDVKKIKPPVWQHQLLSGKFAAEVFTNPNADHTVVVTHAGGLAVRPEVPKPERPRRNAPGVTVAGVGALAPSGKVLFLPTDAGVEAVAILNGKALWTAEGTGEPLLATAEHVIAQVPVKGKKNQIKLAVLDATTGEKVRESSTIELPEWVSVPVEYGRDFRSAARLEKDDLLFVWEARAFTDGGGPPPDPDPNAKRDGGALGFDVKTGRVWVVKDYKPKDEDFVDTLGTKTRVSGWAFSVSGTSDPSSTVGPRTFVSRVLIAEREDGKGTWKRLIASAVHLLPRP